MEDHLGNLWIGTDGGGLNKLGRRTGTFTCYRHDPRNPATLGSDAVFALFEDDSGAIWLGGWDSGLCRLDPASGRVTRFRHDPKDPTSIVNDNIWRILQLRTGELLVTTHFGADLLDRRTGVFTHLSEHDMGATEPLFSAAEDKEGNLWLVGGTFVARIDRRTGRTQRYRNDPQDPKSLGAGWTQAVRIDSAENVWLGTEGGLSCVVAGTREMRRYTTADGLPNNNITGILEDGSGNLWLATNRGLSEFVGAVKLTDRPTFLNFDVHDGLQGYEFARNAACRGKDGEMFFGGSRGLSFFYPERIQRNPHVPPVVLTDLKIFNRSAGIGAPGSPLARAITQTEALTLSYRHSMVTFEFAALNFIIPQKNQYAYRLEGFDSTWNYVGVQRSATYTSLPPGRYTLRVKAANNDGVWNEAGTTLALTVVPPFHRAVWFRLLVLLTATAALAFAYRRHTARMQSHARELAAKVEERTRDLNHLNVELANLNQQLEERVRARTAEVEEEKERLTVTLRSIGDGVIATDVEGRVVLLNRVAEQITGWAPGEAYDRTLGEVMPLVDRRTREPLPDPASLVLERGVVLDLPATAMLVRRDGGEVLIADSAAPICDRQSRIVGVVLVFRDVTERRKVEEELQNAQKLESLGVLAGGIAHDFNNLLTGIFGLVDLARHRSAADAPARGPLERVLAVLDRARGLTGQLLTFSQHGQPVTGPVALSPLLKNCVEFALSGSNVSCSLEMTDDVWPCDGDERQIHQVVDNLLLNARQAMPRGGTVEVQAANVKVPEDVQIPGAPGRYVRITVRDHGEGVPPELRSRIFEPFFTTKPTGSGLGLATSYSIIRKHGGHIEVSSGPGEGAAFVVYLPAASRTPASPAKRETEIPKGLGRILIVDDEDYVREVASELLGELGYTVELAADGDAAVEVCRRAVAEGRPFDAAILDLTIPGGLGGVAAAPLLRRVDSRLPLIASSGYSGDPVMAHPQAYGFAATLNKPFTLEELGTLMARVLKPE
jgi:PAS domain S-box-containing protein